MLQAGSLSVRGMKAVLQLTVPIVLTFVLLTPCAHAGPCTVNIDNMRARIDAALEAKAAAGPTAKEDGYAGMRDQPTPRSMAAVEVKLGELSPRAVDAVEKAMAQASAADAAGDAKACKKALKIVRRILRH
jgi:hypothetical protein